MPAFSSDLFLDVFASMLEFSIILVTLFSPSTQRCQWALFKSGWQKHTVEGGGEIELKRVQTEECKKVLQEPVSQ